MLSTSHIVILAISAVNTVAASFSDRLNRRIDSRDAAGTFQNPSSATRPKFRYWLPDASVDPTLLAADIAEIAKIGGGGIQFLNYFSYGGEYGQPATDWSIYGFGTPDYHDILKAAAQATKDNGLLMDFSLGPESGQGVPAESDNPGLAYDMITYNTTFAPGGNYHGPIPGYGSNSGTLVSVTTAMITNITSGGNVSTIAESSLDDITDSVTSNGTISVTFPADSDAVRYVVFAAYYALSGVRACVPGWNPQNFIQNGSSAVDHFSIRGAKVTTDFLEEYVLIDRVKELFQQIGVYLWEDSVEVESPFFWTPDLASAFNKMHGYDIGKYIMLLSEGNGLLLSSQGEPIPNSFITDAPDRGQGYVSDFRATLTHLLSTYYDHLTNWSNEYLGLQFSAQVGYNFPVDMLQVTPSVDVPEDESLGFRNEIDAYRQVVGPANLAGKNIISNEIGADIFFAYRQDPSSSHSN